MDSLPPAISNRTIPKDFEPSLVWRKNQINIRRGFSPSSGLIAGYGYVTFVNFLGGPLSQINQLDVLDAKTGKTRWQSERFPTYEDVAISQDRAFVLLRQGSPLNIYNLNSDGKSIASLNYFKETTKFSVFPQVVKDNFYVYYVNENEFSLHSMDFTGKEVAPSRTLPALSRLSDLFLFEQPFFLVTGQEYLGGNFETGKELWRIGAPGRIDSRPVLRNNTLIISTGDGKRYQLIAIDVTNGHELWKTEKEFGSNVVLHKDNLYALRNDATLIKFDFKTGQIEAEMPFINPSTIDAGMWAYWLASDGEKLFVYFGDSQELFSFNLG